MHRSSSVLLVAAAALGVAAGCAETPPPVQQGPAHPFAEQRTAARPATNAASGGGATLSPADATAEVAYYRERSLALAGGASTEIARTDFARLRRGRLYLTEGLPDREIEELRRHLSEAFGAENEPAILELTAQLITRNQADIRAHMLRAIALRKTGDEREAGMHHDLAIALLESITAGGDGRSVDSPWTVFDVSEEYEVLKMKGCVPGPQALVSHEDRQFDVLHARHASNGSPCEATFDITELMAVSARHL
jgi:Domain of unknown function (DUF4919)